MTINYETADFYGDIALVDDPHAYFDYLRAKGPVVRLPHRNVVAVTGFEETIQVMLDTEHFSSINAVMGPFPPLPFEPHGDDISAELEAVRGKIPFADQVVTEQGERHSHLRSILAPLFTPGRTKALEPRLSATADMLIDEFVGDGRVNLVSQYGGPYATLVIADLLAIPEKVRHRFRILLKDAIPSPIGATPRDMMKNPLVDIGKDMFRMIAVRRLLNHKALRWLGRGAGGDVLTEVALARFPDGSKPTLIDVTALGAFLFGAGQDVLRALKSLHLEFDPI